MYLRRIGLSTAIAKNAVRKFAAIAVTKTAVQFPTELEQQRGQRTRRACGNPGYSEVFA